MSFVAIRYAPRGCVWGRNRSETQKLACLRRGIMRTEIEIEVKRRFKRPYSIGYGTLHVYYATRVLDPKRPISGLRL